MCSALAFIFATKTHKGQYNERTSYLVHSSSGTSDLQPVAEAGIGGIPPHQLGDGSTGLEEERQPLVELQRREFANDQRLGGFPVLPHQSLVAEAASPPIGGFVRVNSLVLRVVNQPIAWLPVRIVAQLLAYLAHFIHMRRCAFGKAFRVPDAVRLFDDLTVLGPCLWLPKKI